MRPKKTNLIPAASIIFCLVTFSSIAAVAMPAPSPWPGKISQLAAIQDWPGPMRVQPVIFIPNLPTEIDSSPDIRITPVTLSIYSQAWSLITAGQLDEAERLLNRVRSTVPKSFQWLVDDGLAWIAFYRQDSDLAEQSFKSILEEHPGAYLSRKGLGFIAIQRGDYVAAMKHLKKSFRQNPYQILASYTLSALQLVEAGEFKRALEILELGTWVYPQSSDVKFLLARAYIGLGDTEKAAKYAIQSASLAPTYIDPVFDDLELPPNLVLDAYHALGWSLLLVGDNQGALRRFQQYLDNGGKAPNATRGRGFARYRLGEYDQALADLEFASRYEPDQLSPITEPIPGPDGGGPSWVISYNASSTLAWAYYLVGDNEAAVKQFNVVLKSFPDWVDAHTGLGYALAKLGQVEEAKKHFEKALQLLPGYPYAQQWLQQAEAGG